MKYVWINGCFDVLHRGHIELFEYASSLGGDLIVGIDTDERVRSAKGSSRPFNSLRDRIKVLESIKYIKQVVSFEDDEALKYWINFFKPKYLVVGSDWKGKPVIGQEFVEEVLFFDRIPEYSTTKILENK